jgi:hypothetical protein
MMELFKTAIDSFQIDFQPQLVPEEQLAFK